MKKVTELELEKIQQFTKDQNDLNQLKFQLGDLTTQVSVLSDLVKQKHIMLMKAESELGSTLEAKYGKGFQIDQDGNIVDNSVVEDAVVLNSN